MGIVGLRRVRGCIDRAGGAGRIGCVLGVTIALIAWAAVPAGTAGAATGTAGSAHGRSGVQVDFPEFMYNAAHSAFSPATSIAAGSKLRLVYAFKEKKVVQGLRARFVATPLVIDHVIYIGSNSGEFYAINLDNGSIIWQEFLGYERAYQCRPQGFFATAASGIDPKSGALTIYAPSGDGNLYALRASDGNILWKTPVNVPDPKTNDYYNYSAPEIGNGKIYIGVSSECDNSHAPVTVRGGLIALDQGTGKQIARYYTVPAGESGGSVWTSPAIAPDGSVLVATGAEGNRPLGDMRSIVRLDPNTLQKLDSNQIVTPNGDSDFGGSPTIFNANLNGTNTEMVGACNKDGEYYAWKLDNLSAGPVWQVNIAEKNNTTGNCDGAAIFDGHYLYVGGCRTNIKGVSYRGSMRKLNPATGAAIWATGLPVAIRTTPTLDAAGAIAATSLDGSGNSGFLFDANTGAPHLVSDGNSASASSPVFADQYLVIATGRGVIDVYATD